MQITAWKLRQDPKGEDADCIFDWGAYDGLIIYEYVISSLKQGFLWIFSHSWFYDVICSKKTFGLVVIFVSVISSCLYLQWRTIKLQVICLGEIFQYYSVHYGQWWEEKSDFLFSLWLLKETLPCCVYVFTVSELCMIKKIVDTPIDIINAFYISNFYP